jgi:succinate dehydrogenase / fumarate reductase, membrane anchor subunit
MVKQYTKNPVGAHYGTRGFLLQRFTAVVMAVYTVVAFLLWLYRAPADYADYRLMFSGAFGVFTLLALAALLYHAWIGMRDILIDYVKPLGIRLTAQFLVATVLAFYLLWAAAIFWGRA